jgi:hypothetical protein
VKDNQPASGSENCGKLNEPRSKVDDLPSCAQISVSSGGQLLWAKNQRDRWRFAVAQMVGRAEYHPVAGWLGDRHGGQT